MNARPPSPIRDGALARTARAFLRDQEGATAVEYAMIAAGIGAFIAAAVWALGTEVRTSLFERLAAVF